MKTYTPTGATLATYMIIIVIVSTLVLELKRKNSCGHL